jgi:hypothetical protein
VYQDGSGHTVRNGIIQFKTFVQIGVVKDLEIIPLCAPSEVLVS